MVSGDSIGSNELDLSSDEQTRKQGWAMHYVMQQITLSKSNCTAPNSCVRQWNVRYKESYDSVESAQTTIYLCVGVIVSKQVKVKIYRTIILLVVLYGCETWAPTLRGERRLRVVVNGVLRRIFGPKKDEVTGEWRKLHNKELYDLLTRYSGD